MGSSGQAGGRRGVRRSLVAACCAGGLALSCGSGPSVGGFEALRVVSADANLRLGASSAERFGFTSSAPRASAPSFPANEAAIAPSSVPDGPRAGGFTWRAPEGWTQGPPRPLREVTFLAGERGEVECYVSVLGGDGGGVRSNLDRWRAQMGQGALSAQELADLEHVPALGVRAALIEIGGDYRGMGGEQVAQGALLGAVAMLEGRTVFVKLVGPAPLVAAERERFRAFVGSLEVTR